MNSADDFRRSIEASLPPLTQYGAPTGAPGVYGAFGWGTMFGGMGAHAAPVDSSVRASRASQEASVGFHTPQEPGVDLSASLRNSFTRYQVPPHYNSNVHALRDSFQARLSMDSSAPVDTSLAGYAASGNAAELPPRYPPAPVQSQPLDQGLTQHYYGKPPTAPVAPMPGPGGDATVVVMASPRKLYPTVPEQPAPAPAQPARPQRRRWGDDPAQHANQQQQPQQQQAPAVAPQPAQAAPQDDGNVRFAEQVTYHYYQSAQQPQQQQPQQQQPQQPQNPAYPKPYQQAQPAAVSVGPNGVVQGKVVHMRRTEAWTKYIAYEGCLQVCTSELERGPNANAVHFLTGAFATLRNDLGIDGLLLTQVTGMPAQSMADGGANDICWDDMEPPEKRLNTVTFANTTISSYMRIRCQRLSLPSASVLQKLCCRTRTHMVLPSFSNVTVHLGPSDDSCDPASYSLDGQGAALQHGQAVVFQLDSSGSGSHQHLQAQQAVPPPQQLDIHVEGPSGVIATGSVPYRELWRLAMAQREPVDEARANSVGSPVEVQVTGVGEYHGKVATVTVLVTRVRKDVAGYELAQVAVDGVGVDTVNKNTLRTNACLAYDTALQAALDATGCGRHKLLVEGPWEWLLSNFAAYFGVRAFYCMLAHLRWVLKPGVATISSMCLDVIGNELRPLLEQSALRALTTHEATLLEGVKKAVELLLEVAFENYYALGDDQLREGAETPRGQSAAAAWRPTVLMASFRLFRTMKDVFLPTDQDWLNTRFRLAAKKRWHFLECNCGYDQLRGLGAQQQQQPTRQAAPKLGLNANTHDNYYKMAEKMGMAIRSDLEFDIFLQKQPDLLPSALNLPRITAEEYMANFVDILRNMLARCPPLVPSVAAVDLLVATAQLQRYLQETQLYMPRQHPGHLDAMELWRPHVLSWIDNSRRGLCGHCGKLEAEAKLSAAHLARVDVAKMPGMIEGIEGAVAPLVHDMLDRTWAELMLYERVIKNWPLFGPHLEAALCDVLRTVQGSLNRICAGASNATMANTPGMPQGPGGSPAPMHAVHRRLPSAGPMGAALNNGGPMHARNPSNPPYGAGSPGMAGRGSPGVAMVPQPGGHGGMGGGMMPGGRNAVLLKEAVLLNSCKVLMVMVPSIEDIISKWCGGHAVAPPGPPSSGPGEGNYGDDDLAPHIGAQFAMVVKELRTDYAEGVASTANRMANHIRATPATNIKAALNQPKPPTEPHAQGGYQQVSQVTQQRDFVEGFMRPILAACDEALQALRAALDPRVFVATGRALWDCMGRDLFEFVHFLQESHDNKGAWRLRQHANLALTQLCDFFRARLAASMEHCIGDRDLDLPINVDKAQKLLAQNTAVVNITLNPI